MGTIATKTVRLNARLVSEAELKSQLNNRSTPMQIERWAQIGAIIEDHILPKDLASLMEGRSEVHIEAKKSRPVDLTAVFEKLESDRKSGELSKRITSSKEWFEIYEENPDYIIKVSHDGTRVIGKITNGVFKAVKSK